MSAPLPAPAHWAQAIAAARARAGAPPLAEPLTAQLALHFHLLYTWNRRFSLTAIRDPHAGLARHLLEALDALPLVTAGPDDLLVDLGSGNGYPAVPLLAAWPEARGLLVEASAKKADFLRAVLRETRLATRVTILERRIDRPRDLPRDATIVTLRGFPDPCEWIAGAAQLPRVRAIAAWLGNDDAAAAAGALAAPWHVHREPPPSTGSGTLLVALRDQLLSDAESRKDPAE